MKWSTYNQSLVKHGKILIDFGVIGLGYRSKRDEQRQGWIRNHFIILIPFFFYLNMPKYTFAFHTNKLKKVLLKDMPIMEKYLQFLITVQ
jgi:hypothetical protein